MATSDWDEVEEAGGGGTSDEGEEADVGLVGGGSLAETMDNDDGPDEADEHGDNLTRADEESL